MLYSNIVGRLFLWIYYVFCYQRTNNQKILWNIAKRAINLNKDGSVLYCEQIFTSYLPNIQALFRQSLYLDLILRGTETRNKRVILGKVALSNCSTNSVDYSGFSPYIIIKATSSIQTRLPACQTTKSINSLKHVNKIDIP